MWISWMLFSLRGRIRRRDWWIGAILLGMLQSIGEFMTRPEGDLDPVSPAAIGFTLLMLWPTLALAVKREHDRDRSGWLSVAILSGATALSLLQQLRPGMPDAVFLALTAIGFGGLLWLLVVLGIRDGTPGPNRFGPSPKRFDPPPE